MKIAIRGQKLPRWFLHLYFWLGWCLLPQQKRSFKGALLRSFPLALHAPTAHAKTSQTSTWEDGWLLFQSYEKHSYLHPSLGKRSSFDRSPSPLRVHENCRYSIFFQPPSLQRFFARSTRLFSSNIPLRDAVFFFPTHVRISSQEAYFDRVQPNRPYNKKQNIKYRSTTDFQSCDTYTQAYMRRLLVFCDVT